MAVERALKKAAAKRNSSNDHLGWEEGRLRNRPFFLYLARAEPITDSLQSAPGRLSLGDDELGFALIQVKRNVLRSLFLLYSLQLRNVLPDGEFKGFV